MIFNLFKSKPTLKELIPKGFVDIHSHVLPGLDDGAKNVKESLELISEMKRLGFKKIYGTPHTYPGMYNNTTQSITKSFKIINDRLNEKIEIDYASEYMISHSLIEMAESKSLLTIKDKYILVETSFLSEDSNMYDVIFHLRLNDYIPIMAHPERYLYYKNDIKYFYKLKKFGCLFQINLLSAVGHYGKDVLDLCNNLIKNDLYDFAGSDIHSNHHIEKFKSKVLLKESIKLEKLNSENFIF